MYCLMRILSGGGGTLKVKSLRTRVAGGSGSGDRGRHIILRHLVNDVLIN